MSSRHVCRLCLEEVEPLLDIFGSFGQEQAIREIVGQHFWFELKPDDPLSDKMCTICWSKLIDFQAFYEQVQKAQQRITMVVIDSKPTELKLTAELKDQIVIASHEEIGDDVEVQMSDFKIESEFRSHFEDDDSDIEIPSQNMPNEPLHASYIEVERTEEKSLKKSISLMNECTEPIDSTEMNDSEALDEAEPLDLYAQPLEDDLQTLDVPQKLDDSSQENFSCIQQNIIRKYKRAGKKSKKYNENVSDDIENYSSSSDGYLPKTKKKSGRIKRGRKPMKKEIDEAQKQKEEKLIESYFKMQCEFCHNDMGKFQDLFEHYHVAHQFRGFIVCCGKKFFRRTVIAEHVLWHKQPENFTCSICNTIYVNKRCFDNHMLIHAPPDMKLYQCEHCPKSFIKKFKLDKHKLSHLTDEEKQYICDDCDKPYASDALLRAHKRVVHQHTYAHMCEICAKVFKSRVFFEKHQLEHLGQNLPKVQCQICDAWMKNEHTMRAHMRNHQDEGQEHECDICGKKGPSRNAIAKHKRFVHLSERKFKCTLCDKAFKRAITLKEHMTVHTGEILYTCTFCPKNFNSGANMHAHRKKAHPTEWFEEKQNKLESMKPSEASP